jgi:hypothetical protein
MTPLDLIAEISLADFIAGRIPFPEIPREQIVVVCDCHEDREVKIFRRMQPLPGVTETVNGIPNHDELIAAVHRGYDLAARLRMAVRSP